MSYRITLAGNRKAAARYVGSARQRLLQALADNPGIKQTEIARLLGVHRSVINRQLKGTGDMSMGRAAEIAWALGYKPRFDLVKAKAADGTNRTQSGSPPPKIEFSASSNSGSVSVKSKTFEYA